jgi:hypothetical protein
MQASSEAASRSGIDVMVSDVQALGMIGVVRSLGRSGYRTHGYSSDPEALGLRSRYNRCPAVAPRYDDDAFLPWLRRYVRENRIRALVPTEGCLLALRPVLAEFVHLLPLAPRAAAIYRCLSKFDVLDSFLREPPGSALRNHLPPTVLLRPSDRPVLGERLARLEPPVWVKGDAVHDGRGHAAVVRRCDSVRVAQQVAEELLARYDAVLAQGNATSPVQVGANVLLDGSEVVGASMMLSLHDSPHTGGTSGLRRSWWHDGIHEDSVARLRHLGWQGVAMVEYKWNPRSDAFEFIEVNSRFWAGLHLDLAAGVDYPALLLDRALGIEHATCARGRTGVMTRWTLPTDLGHALSRMRDPALPVMNRVAAPLEFVWNFVAPGVRDDLRYPGDSGLYWRQWRNFLRN